MKPIRIRYQSDPHALVESMTVRRKPDETNETAAIRRLSRYLQLPLVGERRLVLDHARGGICVDTSWRRAAVTRWNNPEYSLGTLWWPA